MPREKLTLASKITVARLGLLPLLAVFFGLSFLENAGRYFHIAILILFFVISMTDFLDGYIARKYNQVTDLGKLLDPIADKVLTIGTLVLVFATNTFVRPEAGVLHHAIFLSLAILFAGLMLAREFLISGMRTLASAKGVLLAADIYGKVKTVVLMMALGLLLIVNILTAFGSDSANILFYIAFGFYAAATILTAYSGINYYAKNRRKLRNEDN